MKSLLQYVRGEGAGRHPRKLLGEGKYEDRVDACCGQELKFFGERGDERLARFRPDDAGRMWIEGDRDRALTKRASPRDNLGDDPLMTAMHAVEVADGGDRRAVVVGDLCELAKYLHQAISKVI